MNASRSKTQRETRIASKPSRTPEKKNPPKPVAMAPHVLELKKIVVPIDLSTTALKALQYAVPLALRSDATITLVHVSELPRLTPGIKYIGIGAAESSRLERKLRELAKHSIPPGVKVDFVIQAGTSHEIIVALASERSADLIVLTTHGYTGLKHVVMGSTAEKVVRYATCPVFVVR